jgi:hypothetical protein
MENQHYKSYEQAALDILRGNKPEEEKPVQKEQQEQDIPQPLSEAEVHPDALHVKPVKMGGQTKYKVHAVGKNFSSGIKPGEHLSDSELDDFSEMGGRIKHMKEQVKPEVGRLEEVEEDYDQLIQENNSFELELPEQLTFADYLNAAKLFTESYEDAVVVADYFFTRNDESLVVEAFTRSDIEDKVKMHQKAGNEASLPKYGMKDNKPYAEYTVTDKESGKKTKYIHHGTMRRVERMN